MDASTTVRATRQEHVRTRGIGYLIGGLALVALSAAINIRHTVSHLHDRTDMALAGGLALAMTVAFVVLPAFAASALRDRRHGFAIAAWIGVLICGGISLTNIVGASMGQRLATSVESADAARKRADAKKLIEKHENEIGGMGAVRPSATIQADIDAKLVSRNDLEGCEAKWLASSKARLVCIEVHQLRAEKAKADQKDRLESEIGEARATLNGTAASATLGNGDTAAIVAAGRKFGFELDGEAVDLVKSVGLALGVELFAALLFVAWERARQMAVLVVGAPDVPSETAGFVAAATVGTRPVFAVVGGSGGVPALECLGLPVGWPLESEAPQAVPGCPIQDEAQGDAVLDVLRARGGSLLASQRAMAELFGMSRSSVNRALHDLASAGRVKLVTTAKGTAVTVIEARAAA